MPNDETSGDAAMIEPAMIEPAPVEETWRRIELVPGVELFVRTDAGAEARRVAREIESQYRAGSR